MKYLFHNGHQLYIPESIEEQRLVWDRIYDLLLMACENLRLWDRKWDRGAEVRTPWFPASAIFPMTAKGESLTRHVDNFADRPDEPYVVTIDLALPTDYENSELVCRWNNRGKQNDHADIFIDFCRKMLGRYQWNEDTLLPTIAKMIG